MQPRSFVLAASLAVVVTAFSVTGNPALAQNPTPTSVSSSAPDAAAAPATATVGNPASTGPVALDGAAAAAYQVPADLKQTWSATYPDGSTQTHYQQVVAGAEVFNGQVTVLRSKSGAVTSVIGAHYDGLKPTNSVTLSAADVRAKAAQVLGAAGTRSARLRLDPRDGHLFYTVETQRFAHRWVQWMDASTGKVEKTYDAVAEGDGVGVKGDQKTIDTTQANGVWQLITADGRQKTYDAKNGTTLPGDLMTDTDNHWNLSLPGNASPSQPPGVDAHYYANVIDDFYRAVFKRNSIDNAGMPIISTVHYDKGYCNAFWNGEQMTYGDGDGVACKPLSGGLDVVGHELTHGVTEFTSGLIYEGESGALNESFSDMMGNTSEFFAAGRGLDPAAQPDWLIGEDVIPAGVYGGTHRRLPQHG